MNSAQHQRLTRTLKLTRTYTRKAADQLAWFSREDIESLEAVRAWIAAEAAELLNELLWDADTLARIASDDQLDELEEKARKLHRVLRSRRIATALADTTGRTPQEAATYARAAEAMSKDLTGER